MNILVCIYTTYNTKPDFSAYTSQYEYKGERKARGSRQMSPGMFITANEPIQMKTLRLMTPYL